MAMIELQRLIKLIKYTDSQSDTVDAELRDIQKQIIYNNKFEHAVTMARQIKDPFGVFPVEELHNVGEAIMNATKFSYVQKSMMMFSISMLS